MPNFIMRNLSDLGVPPSSVELQVCQVEGGFYHLTWAEAAGTPAGYMWMTNPSTNNYTAYYVLPQGSVFPLDLSSDPVVFSVSEEFDGVTTPYAFWETAAGLLGEDMQDVVRAVQQETNVPWPS
jgi:hypothetical protein